VLAGGKELTAEQQNTAANILSMLTSFETYDALARAGHSQEAIVATITRIARAVVDSVE
jgi:hypothetical protein